MAGELQDALREGRADSVFVLRVMGKLSSNRGSIGRVYLQIADEIERLRTALKKHHDWHQSFGECSAPDGKGGYVTWDLSDAYIDSMLCDQTVAALGSVTVPYETLPPEGSENA